MKRIAHRLQHKLPAFSAFIILFSFFPVMGSLGYAQTLNTLNISESKSNNSEEELKNLITTAIKLRSEGKLIEAADMQEKIVAISELQFGLNHTYVAITLSYLAMIYHDQGKYSKAEPLYIRSLAIREKALGPDHPDVATSLNDLASLYDDEGKYSKAEPLYIRSLAIAEKALGPDHPDVAKALSSMGKLLFLQGKYTAAEAAARRSLEINEKYFGAENREVAYSLAILANHLSGQGKFSSAELYLRRSLNIYIKILGPYHQDVADTLNNHGIVLASKGKNSEALPYLNRALMIREKVFGPNHRGVAEILFEQAMIMFDLTKYDKAEQLYRRALAIFEKTLGSDDLIVAQTLNNLAIIIGPVNGQHSEAELLIGRALVIREKKLGTNHPLFAQSLSSLSEILDYQGKYAASEQLQRQVLEIREKNFEPSHLQVGYSLVNLANILLKEGRYHSAEPLIRRGLINLEKNLGQIHPDVARAMRSMASVLAQLGQQSQAELLLKRALVINEKVFGSNHLAVALNLLSLANLFGDQGKYSAAEPLNRRALAITERTFGPHHQHVAGSINDLAVTLWKQGRDSEAESLVRRSLAIEEIHRLDNPDSALTLANLAILLSGKKDFNGAISAMAKYLTIESTWLLRELPLQPDLARSAQLRSLEVWNIPFNWIGRHPAAVNLAFDTRLNRQGLLPVIEYRQMILLNSPDVDRAKVEKLQDLTQQLASVSLLPESRIAVREQRDKLQAEIYRQIPDLQIQLVSSAQVAKSLPADGALVEFQRFRPYNGRKPKDQSWGAAQYIALVLKPDGSISAVPLGPASPIDAQVNKGLRASASGLSDAEAIWAQLSNQILKPLLPHLQDRRQWFLSLDGDLNTVPFAALPSPQQATTTLGQAVQLRLLTTGRELLRLEQPAPAGSTAVVMANPSYDRSGAKPEPATRLNALTKATQRRSTELGNNQWKPLPGSEREGQQVASLLGSDLIKGSEATSSALQRQQAPLVLHVATHGFFVADQESKPTEAMRSIQEESPLLRSLRQEDPQLRSGLVFAGANQPDLDPNDDGYLTAAEAVNLNLKGTELVVLSACSTGQGDARTGEGVYGLQRSLTVAGARSTLLSLWKVDDAATAEFMVRFYKRLKAGEGRSDALAAVQKEFRDGAAGNGQWKEPYYWAAWQLVGDWKPINGL
ncbi:CHAT domain-containing tetratricopeptide repeat protein [Synechococcus sp. UW140]|uniref:CHAT domain-containing tetratricopeptide repeat protein n=1 Tax=Synechococcus sp. UW140 TaxID=368503 RepID=UPI003137FA1B